MNQFSCSRRLFRNTGKILTLRKILFFKGAFQSQFGECVQMFSVELATVKSVDYIDQKIVPTDANEKKV